MSGKAAARQIVRSCNYGGLEETRFRRESMLKKTTDERLACIHPEPPDPRPLPPKAKKIKP